MPEAVGVPDIVATFAAHEPVTPAGKPENVAPVAPVVANVILVIGVLTQVVLLIPAAIVFEVVTVIVPVAEACVQPPMVVTV